LASAQSEPVDAAQSELSSPATTPTSYSALLLKDAEYVLTAAVRWDSDDWRRAAWISGALLGTGLLLDRPIHDAIDRHRSSGLDRLTRRFEPFGGTPRSALILAGFYGYGTLADDQRAIDVAQDGLAATLIASGVIVPVLRDVVGRSRPNANLGTGHFQPFSQHNGSFPSGHATQAFVMATVIASHYDDVGWVPYVAYGTASLVGFSRMYHDAHFASDVLAGAAIGILVGKGVVGFNRRRPDGRGYSITPAVTAGHAGLALQVTF